MNLLQIISLLVSLTAVLAWVNHRWLRLPTTIGVMVISLGLSLALVGLNALGLPLEDRAREWLLQLDFDETLMQGMLSFLLFAGALHINLDDLAQQKSLIAILASLGVVVSTVLVASCMYFVLPWLGLPLAFPLCLLFGALISPTDPIAVLGILKRAGVPKSLETKVAGESLFNDGIGVVVFIAIYEIAVQGQPFSLGHVGILFLLEALGGVVLGLAMGWLAYRMLKSVNNYQVEVLLTLALVMGGYSLAMALHTSGPIAIVVAGLLVGNHGRAFAMSDTTREHLDTFWELVDEILNALLFVLIGLEILVLAFSGRMFIAGLLTIPVVLAARICSVGLPILLLKSRRAFTPGAIPVLAWGGLRGGISVALALSLPHTLAERQLILGLTYIVVIFSIVVQGLTVQKVVNRFVRTSSAAAD